MSRISDLGSITGNRTRSEDLFVTVNLEQGDLGTKNITRSELAKAIQQETFDSINIAGGSIAGISIGNSTISNSIVNTSILNNPTINAGNLSGITIGSNSIITASNLSNVTIEQSIVSNTDISDSRADDMDISNSRIVQSSFTDGSISNASITDGNATGLTLFDPDFNFTSFYSAPIDNDDFFIFKDISTNQTVKILFSDLQNEFADVFKKANKIYVASDGNDSTANGSYFRPYNTLEAAFAAANISETPVAITVLPGTYYTNGNLELPDNSSIVGSNGQYSTDIVMNEGFENNNCILVGSGCYVQGIAFNNLSIDNFDNPTGGFAVAFRPDALILRSPYIRDISQISNYRRQNIAAPLNPRNSQGTLEDLGDDDFPNPLVGRGGGVLLADRSVLNQNSVFPYMLAFGATPRSPNGIGYVAKNGAGINGIGSITIFQRCAFYALNGGQITLNNSGTQFGDISMRAKGFTPVVNPYETEVELVVASDTAAALDAAANTIIDDMWDYLVLEGYTVNEAFTRRDAGFLLQSISYDLQTGGQTSTRNFVAGLFDYKGDHVFSVFNPPTTGLNYVGSVDNINDLPSVNNTINDAFIVYDSNVLPINIYNGNVYVWNGASWDNIGSNDISLLQSFIDSYDFILAEIKSISSGIAEEAMLDALFDDILKATLTNPSMLNFGSLIESIGHQFNLAGAGVNKNALPLNFRRVGQPRSAVGSVLQEDGGRVRFSGADELNNQYFARGLKVNGRTGRLEGRPFTSSVRRLARRAANSRVSI